MKAAQMSKDSLPICTYICAILNVVDSSPSDDICFPDCGQPLPGDGGCHGGAQLQAPGQRHLQVQVQELRGRCGGARGGRGRGQPRAHSLQSSLRLLHRGQGLLQLPGVGRDLGPGAALAAPAPRQACHGVRDLICIPLNIIIYRDACVSQKDKGLSCQRVSNSSSQPSSHSSSKIVNVVLYDDNKFSRTFEHIIRYLGNDNDNVLRSFKGLD